MIGASWMRGQPRERHARTATTTANANTGILASLSAEVRFNHALIGLDDARRTFGDLVAMVEDEHDLAQPHHDLHVVLHQQHRLALVAETAHGVEQVVEEGTVDAGRGLIEQDQRGIAHQHAHELYELLLAIGEIARVLARQLLQLHEGQELAAPAFGGGSIAARHNQEIFERRELGKHPRHLKRTAHALHRDLPRPQAVDALTLEEDPPRVAALDPGDAVEQRRLPGAVRADEAIDPSWLEPQRDTVDRGDAPEALLDGVDLERSGHLYGPWEPISDLQNAQHAARHEQHHGDDDGAEQQLVDVREACPDDLLRDEQDDGAEHGSPHGALSTEQHHHDHGDRRGQRKHADRLDVPLVARGQPADDTWRDGGEQERIELVARGVDPHGLGGHLVLADRHEPEAEARGDDRVRQRGDTGRAEAHHIVDRHTRLERGERQPGATTSQAFEVGHERTQHLVEPEHGDGEVGALQ